MTWAVLTDFDGTITLDDVAEAILEAFAPGDWWGIERLHRDRKIGTREAMARQFALVQAGKRDLLDFVDGHARLDETFREFLAFCASRTLTVEIVSEGLDFYVDHLLAKWRLDVPSRTNRATFHGNRVDIDHPWADPTCTLCGTCKLLRVFQLRADGHRVAYVGDGTSDLCPALEADLVFAKGALATLCHDEDIPFIPFRDFSEVQRELEARL